MRFYSLKSLLFSCSILFHPQLKVAFNEFILNLYADISNCIFIMWPTCAGFFFFFPRKNWCLHLGKPTVIKISISISGNKLFVNKRLLWVQGTRYGIRDSYIIWLLLFISIIYGKLIYIKILATHPKWLIEIIITFFFSFLHPFDDEHMRIHWIVSCLQVRVFFHPHNILYL